MDIFNLTVFRSALGGHCLTERKFFIFFNFFQLVTSIFKTDKDFQNKNFSKLEMKRRVFYPKNLEFTSIRCFLKNDLELVSTQSERHSSFVVYKHCYLMESSFTLHNSNKKVVGTNPVIIIKNLKQHYIFNK